MPNDANFLPDPRGPSMLRKKLPIGIQTFAKIRQEHCYYVDKTPFVA
ncbi:MAG: hypothetical protein JG760_655, partial [Desulfomicrobiaceae bacterium]|nr:hypothetical protein [Desulfomicrobiaceae bacterium]